MGKKYIVEIGRLERLYKAYVNGNGKPNLTWLSPEFDLTLYTEPDLEQVRKEAYEDGYKTAKVQCNIQAEKDLREVGERHYQKGLSDAWEAARKIIHMPEGDLLNIFTECYSAVCTALQVVLKYDASECIEKIQAYEQEKKQEEEQIQVGDEVRNIKNGWIAVVSNIDGECMTLMDTNGALGDGYDVNRFTKTGRRFPEIAEVLEKMRGGQDG